MDNTFAFELRSDKTDSRGLQPVRVVYRVEGDRERFATSIKINPGNWNSKEQRAVYKDKETAKAEKLFFANLMLNKDIERINEDLKQVETIVEDIEKDYKKAGVKYSARMVKTEYERLKAEATTTKKDESRTLVYEYIDKYIVEQSTTLTKGTLVVFKSLKKHLQDYAKENKASVLFSGMNIAFFKAFQNYLIETKKLRNTTTAKQLSTLKTVLRYAEAAGVETNNKYKDFTIKREALPVIALTETELSSLFYFDLSDKTAYVNATKPNGEPYKISYYTLGKVRDILCFMAETGIRISDAMNLKHNNILTDKIKVTIVKTKQALEIPLSDFSKFILDKYKETPYPTPRMSNQKFNMYVKELCKLVGINSPVEIVRFRGAERITENYPKYELCSAHVGRKTFCTLSLERGMSAEQTMLISGHLDYKSFKRYVNVTYKVAKKAMDKTRGEIDYKRLMRAV